VNFNNKITGISFIIVFIASMFIKPALCFIELGLLMSILCVSAILFIEKMYKTGIKCVGTIVSIRTDSEGYQTPLVEFTTISGQKIAKEPYVSASTNLNRFMSKKKQYGSEVSVLYDPEDPNKFIVDTDDGFATVVFVFLTLVGLASTVIGVCSFLGYIKLDV